MISDSVTVCEQENGRMMQYSEQGVQLTEQIENVAQMRALLSKLNWNDLHLMREVSGHGSFRKAAVNLRLSINTVRARIDRLEAALKTTLFRRGKNGLTITAEGRTVLQIVCNMQAASFDLPVGKGNQSLVKDGELRICASEGLATFWLTPRLLDLKRRLPDLIISLESSSDQTRIKPDDYDLSIGFVRPSQFSMVTAKIGTVHMMPFASDGYLRNFGTPTTIDDLTGHQCVQQEAPGLSYNALRFFLGESQANKVVSFRVSSSYSLFWAVASGIGIGALPTYIRAISKRVQPVDVSIRPRFELWLSYKEEAKKSQPVNVAASWARQCFDPVAYPWFRDEFIHPDDFEPEMEDSQVIPIFDHLIDETH
jgi:DNA-binding transcriptional LysR family regulator